MIGEAMTATRDKAMTLEEFMRVFTPAAKVPHVKENATEVSFGNTFSVSVYGLSDLELWPYVPNGFETAWGWCEEPYRIVWVNLQERAIITYCEGDVNVSVSPDAESFRLERISARKFYEKPRYMDRDFHGLDSQTDDPEARGE